MSRKYEKVQELLPIIKARLAEGKTQREIAEAMSTSREVVGRALKRLSDANIISYEKGTITILSVEKLKINR